MKLSEYVKQHGHGAMSHLAREINSHPVDVGRWVKETAPVPVHRAVQIERATGGAVTRQDLRPKDWADIWPELAQAQPATLN